MAAGVKARLGLLAMLLLVGAMGCTIENTSDKSRGADASSSAERAARKAHHAKHPPNSHRVPDPGQRPRPEHARNRSTHGPERGQPPEDPHEHTPRKVWQVTRVVDGDTVEVRYRGRPQPVRLIGIDTPETVHPSEPVECWGPQASAAADQWLDGRQVRIEFDPSQGRRDSYDRLLAYLVAPMHGDFGLRMIRAGHAAEYTYDGSYANQGAYRAAERRARSADRGLWHRCGGIDAPLHATEPPPSPQPLTGGRCADGYSPCVPPYPPDVDCADVGGPVRVGGRDPHALDADGDGMACEA